MIRFFEGPGQTVLQRGEILTEIVVPKQSARTAGAYQKFSRRAAMELPLIGVGVLLSLEDHSNRCAKAHVSLGVAAPTPIRTLNAERYLVGKDITEGTLSEAGQLAAEESHVRDSIRGLAWYRREMVSVFVRAYGREMLGKNQGHGSMMTVSAIVADRILTLVIGCRHDTECELAITSSSGAHDWPLVAGFTVKPDGGALNSSSRPLWRLLYV